MLERTNKDPSAAASAMEFLSQRENIVEGMIDWVWTYDPRNINMGLPTKLPFIPFPKQIEFIEWFYNQYLNNKGGLVEKTRDAGATWLFVLCFVNEWRWRDGFSAGVGSNKLNAVNEKDNPKSIFTKIRQLLDSMPVWWMPIGWNPKKHDVNNTIFNPEKGSSISGEGGDNIGRGDRRSVYLVDEKAYLEHPDSADAALSRTTNCQFDLSTPNGMNNFGIKRHSGRVDVFTFSWRNDPRKSQEWYDIEKEKTSPVIFAQEVDIDYNASVDNIFIPAKHVSAAIITNPDYFINGGTISAGLDIAAGGANKTSLAVKDGNKIFIYRWSIKNGIDSIDKAIELCNKHKVDYLNYDRIGVGYTAYSYFDKIEEDLDFKVFGLLASGSPSEVFYPEFNKKGSEMFLNSRSEWWYGASRIFENTYNFINKIGDVKKEDIIIIEQEQKLISQLSSPLRVPSRSGKIQCESKDDMRKRGVQSPDEADAVVMALVPQFGGRKKVLDRFLLSGDTEREEIQLSSHKSNQTFLVSLWSEKNLETSCTISQWNSEISQLHCFFEAVFPYPNPEIVIPRLNTAVNFISEGMIKNISEFTFIGNDVLFDKDRQDVCHFYRRAGHWLQPNAKFNAESSIIYLTKILNMKKAFILSPRIKKLKAQINQWSYEKNQPQKEGFGLVLSLCNTMSFLFETGKIRNDVPRFGEYSPAKMRHNELLDRLLQAGDHDGIAALTSNPKNIIFTGGKDENEKDRWLL